MINNLLLAVIWQSLVQSVLDNQHQPPFHLNLNQKAFVNLNSFRSH